jgi:hypothetical protein
MHSSPRPARHSVHGGGRYPRSGILAVAVCGQHSDRDRRLFAGKKISSGQPEIRLVRSPRLKEQVCCSRVPGLRNAITIGVGSFPEFPASHGPSRLDRTRRWLPQRFPASRRRRTASCTTGISRRLESRGYRLLSFRLPPKRGAYIRAGEVRAHRARGKRRPRCAKRCAIALKPRPAICGKMYHIQCVRFCPRDSSSTTCR